MSKDDVSLFKFFGTIGIVVFLIGVIIVPVNRMYDVWSESKIGEGELARAESNRQIKTLEAQASEESAKHLAQAEIIRARGVAAANKIIGDSLRDNESYLRYLWITNLDAPNKEIIYIPTEAGMPILEAGRGVK